MSAAAQPATARADEDARLVYRPALDGLRALAVVAVMCYHFEAFGVRGGFFGVDVFFVLSGFLITERLVAEQVHHGAVRFRMFYARRALRLLPALALLLTVVVTAEAINHTSYRGYTNADALATALYVANWYRIARPILGATPLDHTWSLSIEEQFYLVWPVVVAVIVVGRASLRKAFWITVTLAVISAIEMWLIGSGGRSSALRAYYGTDTRAQALLAGAALAIAARARWLPRSRVGIGAVRLIGAVSIAVLLTMFATEKRALSFHGSYTVAALVATGVVLDIATGGGMLAWILGWRPFRFVGRISYGLYLWHWPVIFWVTPHLIGHRGFLTAFVARVVATFAIAIASFYLLERPILRWGQRFRRVETAMPD